MSEQMRETRVLARSRRRRAPQGILLFTIVLALLLAACATSNGQGATPAPTTAPSVNGFGSAANHVHSLIALPPAMLLLATHYGLFRSTDGGAHWQEVAGGPGQVMQQLMTYSLSASPLDPQRLYVLTYPTVSEASGIPGLYTSSDQGRTWKLMATTASLTHSNIFLAVAGNDTPNEVYIYLPEREDHGLLVSLDGGAHFTETGRLPFGVISGLLPLPGAPGRLLVYSSAGMALSTDRGAHWQAVHGITGGIIDVTTAGPHAPIYASGDAGMYVSRDGGATFTASTATRSFFLLTSLATSPGNPEVLYGETATSIYRSSDGGRHWSSLPSIRGNLSELAVSPDNPMQVYLSLSYPTAVYLLNSDGQRWQSLTPPASPS
jgi:hypothetical protein